jgi:hypothetical protein
MPNFPIRQIACADVVTALDAAPGGAAAAFVLPTGGAATITLADLAAKIVTPDWLSGETACNLPWPVPAATAAILSGSGKIAGVFASRTSNLSATYGSTQTTIGAAFFGVNDDTRGLHLTAYGFYAEGQALPGSYALTWGGEIDAVNLSGLPAPVATPGNPDSWGGPGVTCGTAAALWLASGGQHAGVLDASFAIGIKDNGARFQSGIVFGASALTAYAGFGFAMRLAKGHLIQWHDASDVAGPNIGSTVATAANAISLQFQDGGVAFFNAAGNPVAAVQSVAGAVNGLAIQPAVSGSGATLIAIGTDANVNINLVPKGTGAVYVPALLSAAASLVVTGSAVVSNGLTVSAGATAVAALSATAATAGTLTLNAVGTAITLNNSTSGPGSSAGTLTNAPAAGNPAFWLPVVVNGTTRHIPCW